MVPELQSNTLRLEVLAHLALAACQGRRKPNAKILSRLFLQFGNGTAGRPEDSVEDVFVSNIATRRGNFRLLKGVWESAGFYVQRIVRGNPQLGELKSLSRSPHALMCGGGGALPRPAPLRSRRNLDIVRAVTSGL